MTKCPLCGFDNEDGALFCEQCKSDLGSVPSTPAPAPEPAMPMAAVIDEPAIPVAAVELAPPMAIDAFPVLGLDSTMPMADVKAEAPMAETVAEAAAPAAAPAPTAPAPTAPAAPAVKIAPGSQPRLKVMRGLKVGVEFPIYAEYNYIGRADEKPVDVDLEDQEPPDRVWCSRQHAVIHFDEAAGTITVEDLNSSNGTYVNRTRVYPGEKKVLNPNDVVQIGTVHMKLLV